MTKSRGLPGGATSWYRLGPHGDDVTGEEQRQIALVLTNDAERERRLRNGGTVLGIEAAAIRRFTASLARKRSHVARRAGRGRFKALAGRLLSRTAELFDHYEKLRPMHEPTSLPKDLAR